MAIYDPYLWLIKAKSGGIVEVEVLIMLARQLRLIVTRMKFKMSWKAEKIIKIGQNTLRI